MTIREYNHCVDECSDGIYRFLLKNIRNTELARDLVQDSFMKLWLKRKDVSYEKSKSYLFTTAYHTMIDHVRKSDRQGYDVDERVLSNLEGAENNYTDVKEVLNLALDRLPAIQKSVVLLRDYEGYAYKEIGEITGLSETQVKVYIYRARLFLKKYIVSMETVL
ncbi:MAG: RNA polymerase sigma factor [Bacteroidetes bacterium]|nr:MAG: RNA polymerase sigma factor [Bacteroidota bacterium]RLD48491.1 MAG: RNA polymerase sigma factor [Bacteroidota bacterium]RLD73953.1 MAG: RNA polymerase sigma factor [Bacteroidota bacterium]RLD87701.1 MAG: RNA polymerase sigma factor [Bacteroidota bacterium]